MVLGLVGTNRPISVRQYKCLIDRLNCIFDEKNPTTQINIIEYNNSTRDMITVCESLINDFQIKQYDDINHISNFISDSDIILFIKNNNLDKGDNFIESYLKKTCIQEKTNYEILFHNGALKVVIGGNHANTNTAA